MDSTKVPLGSASDVHHTYVDPDNVVAYALASNDDNPLYLDGSAVPPLFAVRVAWDAFRGVPVMPTEATEGMRGGVHGEHDLFLRKPMRPGTWLHTVGDISSVVCSRAGMNVFFRLLTTDEDGDTVIEQYWSRMLLGEATGGNHGTPPPDHSFAEESRVRPVGSTRLDVTRDQSFRYAGASGDHSGLHLDDEAARRNGFPRKFLQGLCTLAMTSRALIDLGAGRDPRRVRRIAVRFSAPVYPGDSFDVSLYEAGTTADGDHAYAFEAASNGQATLRHGRVEVAPA